jgi:universal stress protein E
MQTLRHLVVGTDFSPAADAALDFAIGLAKAGSAAITLVHVCELTEEHGFDAAHGTDDVLSHCRTRIAEACAIRGSCGVEIKPVLRSGHPADKIHNVATEVGASLIVIGRGSRTELGNVAARVLRTASRPVLAVGRDPLAATEAP